MAYLVFSTDGLCAKICANDEEKNNLILPNESDFVIKSVSDSDFINVKSNQKWASLSDDTISYQNVDVTFTSSAALKTHFDNLKAYMLSVKNHPSHPIHDGVV